MTLELIKTIAMLCQISIAETGSSHYYSDSEKYQTRCQGQLVVCVAKMTKGNETDKLATCIMLKYQDQEGK